MAETRIFHTSDIHGSELCFRKFVSAAKFYNAQVLILGGDITGKMIVPIIEQSDGTFNCQFFGEKRTARNPEELRALEEKIRNAGFYHYRTNASEFQELERNPQKVDELFTDLMVRTFEAWVGLLEKNLSETGIKCFVMPGNDDRLEIDAVLSRSGFVINPEGKIVQLDDYHEMISTGYANITPWNCPRDIPEEELATKINSMIANVKNMSNCIFNFHCPPFGSGLDLAPHLDQSMRPIIKSGQIEMIPVGSTAAKESIEKHQPLLGLHGHIHESKGFAKIGRTLCINPGSEYGEGYLRGVIVILDKEKVKKYQFTTG